MYSESCRPTSLLDLTELWVPDQEYTGKMLRGCQSLKKKGRVPLLQVERESSKLERSDT